jgi:hypothetical protein
MSPRASDIFEMLLPDGRLAYGVAVIGGGTPYIIVLKSVHTARPDLSLLITDEIALVGRTMDALIHHGRWPIVGTGYRDRGDVPYPNWKVLVEGRLMVTDFSGTPLRPITPEEDQLLDFRFSQSPIAFQNAMESLHGLRDWRSEDDKLTVEYARRRVLPS